VWILAFTGITKGKILPLVRRFIRNYNSLIVESDRGAGKAVPSGFPDRRITK
jgi:hypothetical protein